MESCNNSAPNSDFTSEHIYLGRGPLVTRSDNTGTFVQLFVCSIDYPQRYEARKFRAVVDSYTSVQQTTTSCEHMWYGVLFQLYGLVESFLSNCYLFSVVSSFTPVQRTRCPVNTCITVSFSNCMVGSFLSNCSHHFETTPGVASLCLSSSQEIKTASALRFPISVSRLL